VATSGQYTYTVTRDTIIRMAMLNLGKLAGTETPTPQELTDCATFLNMLVRQWMGRQDFANGLKMWTRYHADIILSYTKGIYTLSPIGDNWAAGVANVQNPNLPNLNLFNTTAATASGSNLIQLSTAASAYVTASDFFVAVLSSGDIFSSTVNSVNTGTGVVTLAANVPTGVTVNSGAQCFDYTTKGQPLLEIQSALLRDNQQNDTPLNYMTLQEYEGLPTKVQPGYISDPTAIYHEPQLTSAGLRSSTLYLDVAGAQDVTKTIHIVGLRPIQSFVNPTDNPDYPEDWAMALSLGLSRLIAPMFNAVWTNEMDNNLKVALAMAQETPAETTAMYFLPYQDDY
jgi:hypothetical protein